MHLETKNIFKSLILLHCFEIFEKSYLHQVESDIISNYPVDIQYKFTNLYKYWIKRKENFVFADEKDFIAIKELISLWEYI